MKELKDMHDTHGGRSEIATAQGIYSSTWLCRGFQAPLQYYMIWV